MDFLRFALSGPFTFIGVMILLGMVLQAAVSIVAAIANAFRPRPTPTHPAPPR